jgi:hypothetical protein
MREIQFTGDKSVANGGPTDLTLQTDLHRVFFKEALPLAGQERRGVNEPNVPSHEHAGGRAKRDGGAPGNLGNSSPRAGLRLKGLAHTSGISSAGARVCQQRKKRLSILFMATMNFIHACTRSLTAGN